MTEDHNLSVKALQFLRASHRYLKVLLRFRYKLPPFLEAACPATVLSGLLLSVQSAYQSLVEPRLWVEMMEANQSRIKTCRHRYVLTKSHKIHQNPTKINKRFPKFSMCNAQSQNTQIRKKKIYGSNKGLVPIQFPRCLPGIFRVWDK